jgi:hypothetical protein
LLPHPTPTTSERAEKDGLRETSILDGKATP